MTVYKWFEFPIEYSPKFESEARAALSCWVENTKKMEIRLNSIDAGYMPVFIHTASIVLTDNDLGKRHIADSFSSIDFKLPEAKIENIGKTIFFRKKGTGNITLIPQCGDNINGFEDLTNVTGATGQYINLYVECENCWAIDNIFGGWEPSSDAD